MLWSFEIAVFGDQAIKMKENIVEIMEIKSAASQIVPVFQPNTICFTNGQNKYIAVKASVLPGNIPSTALMKSTLYRKSLTWTNVSFQLPLKLFH